MAFFASLKKFFCGEEPPVGPPLPERLAAASAAVAELRQETSLPQPLLPLLSDLDRLLGEALEAAFPVQAQVEGALAELESLLPVLHRLEAAGDRAAWSRDLDRLYQKLEDCLRDLSVPLPGEALCAAPENSALLRSVLPATMQLRQRVEGLEQARKALARALAGHGPDLRAPEDAAELMAPLRGIAASAQTLIAQVEKKPERLQPVGEFLERYLEATRNVVVRLAEQAEKQPQGAELDKLGAGSLEALQGLERAFAGKIRAVKAGNTEFFAADLAALDELLQEAGQ